jgi:hypothetical protein
MYNGIDNTGAGRFNHSFAPCLASRHISSAAPTDKVRHSISSNLNHKTAVASTTTTTALHVFDTPRKPTATDYRDRKLKLMKLRLKLRPEDTPPATKPPEPTSSTV